MANWQNGQHLEPGITLLEASAGTGKTFRIAHIVMRLLAEDEDMRMDQVAVLSFTRAATSELKDRIRRRMAVRCLDDGEVDRPPDLTRSCAVTWRPWMCRRAIQPGVGYNALNAHLMRLISTIHGFCQRLMTQNAFETGAAFGIEPKRVSMDCCKRLSTSSLPMSISLSMRSMYRLGNAWGTSTPRLGQDSGG